MRRLNGYLVAGLILTACLMASAAASETGKPVPKAQAKRQTKGEDELMAMVRRAAEAAEAAQAEARRARQQTEALQQQLAQTEKELASLRQQLENSAIASLGSRIADLKKDVIRLAETVNQSVSEPAIQSGNQLTENQNSQLENRLEKLEEQSEINAAQLKEHAQTKVESDARFRLRLSGMILANTYLNTADSTVRSAPTRAPSPSSPFASSRKSVGSTLRQSIIGLAMEGPKVGGAKITAEGEFDFYAITSDDLRGNTLGALRLRTASARLDWERTALTIGLRPAMISPLNPASLASVWYPALSGAGNLWQWRPQIILEHRPRIDDSSELVLQGGLMTAFGETLDSSVIEGRLTYQGRAAIRRTLDIDRKVEIGLAGQYGKNNFSFKRQTSSYVVSSDWLIPIGSRLELSGEGYFGKAVNLGEQSGVRADAFYALSGALENPATVIRGVHTFGGWGQLNLKARRDLDFNLAFGLEDPRNGDVLSDAAIRRTFTPYFSNRTATANFIYQLRPNFLISLEYRRIWTDYVNNRRRNDHYNLAFGYLF